MCIRDRISDVLYFYVDGQLDFSSSGVSSMNVTGVTYALVGAFLYSDVYFGFNGYIDELRLSKGIARWTTNFTPQVTPYEPDAYTVLLLHCESHDVSDSVHIPTFVGNAQIDTSDKKFGTGSLILDGNSDYLQFADSDDWDVVASNSDNWTIDLWVKHTDHVGSEIYLSQIDVGGTEYWQLFHEHGVGLKFEVYDDPSVIITLSGGEITDSDWHHIALCKVADKYGIYKDGTQIAYVQDSSTLTLSEDLRIGFNRFDYFDGNMDEIRIKKSNTFFASPNSDKTDTIIVPTSSHGNTPNMILISDTFTADSEPSQARIVIFEEDIDAVTLNTDLKVYISRDGGSTWAEVTLSDEGDYDTSKRILVGNVDLSVSGIGSGTDMVYKHITGNNKDLKIHGTGLLWD